MAVSVASIQGGLRESRAQLMGFLCYGSPLRDGNAFSFRFEIQASQSSSSRSQRGGDTT